MSPTSSRAMSRSSISRPTRSSIVPTSDLPTPGSKAERPRRERDVLLLARKLRRHSRHQLAARPALQRRLASVRELPFQRIDRRRDLAVWRRPAQERVPQRHLQSAGNNVCSITPPSSTKSRTSRRTSATCPAPVRSPAARRPQSRPAHRRRRQPESRHPRPQRFRAPQRQPPAGHRDPARKYEQGARPDRIARVG